MSIIMTLQQLQQGALLKALDQALKECALAAQAEGKATSLTLKLSIKPASKGDGLALNLSGVVTTKLPSPDGVDGIMYAQSDGTLSRRDPRQPEIPFTVVGDARAEQARSVEERRFPT